MVHHGHINLAAMAQAPACPRCGSHRTEVIGRLEDGRSLILRCNACGTHTTVMTPDTDETGPFPEPIDIISHV